MKYILDKELFENTERNISQEYNSAKLSKEYKHLLELGLIDASSALQIKNNTFRFNSFFLHTKEFREIERTSDPVYFYYKANWYVVRQMLNSRLRDVRKCNTFIEAFEIIAKYFNRDYLVKLKDIENKLKKYEFDNIKDEELYYLTHGLTYFKNMLMELFTKNSAFMKKFHDKIIEYTKHTQDYKKANILNVLEDIEKNSNKQGHIAIKYGII